MSLKFKLIILILLLGFGSQLMAYEHIKSFHSDITLNSNGDVFVTETIQVVVEHNKIRRGIFRDFPTLYQTALLTKSSVDFELIKVLRNGRNEPHHTEKLSNGVRIYIGNRSGLVERGDQTYTISYRTNRQIAFEENFDRFYWNVTGNDWRFSMNQVTAEVHLPDGVSMSMVNSEAWTGFAGENSAEYSSEVNGNVIVINSTAQLKPYQGLTFSLEIPKGIIVDNSNWLSDFLSDNMMWVLMVLTFLALLMFYLLAWNQVGRDPEPGVIFPAFYPPKDISPAAMRYILDEKTDHKNFTSALINLAVKGYVKMKKINNGYQITKLTHDSKSLKSMSSGEHIIMKWLFGGNKSSIRINKKYDSKIKTAMKRLSDRLKSEYKVKCFKDNKMIGYFGIGVSILVLLFFMMHLNMFNSELVAQMLAPLAITGFALYTILSTVRGSVNGGTVISHGLIMIVFFMSSAREIPLELIIISVVLVLFNGVFIYLLKSPTPFGRELMDKIEGFKLYLSTAEQHRLDIMHPPEMTSELFEEYLPYAMALGVENRWSERFAQHLKASGIDPKDSDYSPNWYSGSHFNLSSSSNGFGAISSGMASTISAASVPPSSSGGSGGGGFSGGGGGGGGGGGW